MKQFKVAVKAVIFKEGKALLMRRHNSEYINPNTWDLPGGRIEFGEELKTALRREVEEETGLKIKILQPAKAWSIVKKDLHLVGITFVCEYVKGQEKLSDEHTEHKWISRKDIEKLKVPIWFKKELKAAFKIKGLS